MYLLLLILFTVDFKNYLTVYLDSKLCNVMKVSSKYLSSIKSLHIGSSREFKILYT